MTLYHQTRELPLRDIARIDTQATRKVPDRVWECHNRHDALVGDYFLAFGTHAVERELLGVEVKPHATVDKLDRSDSIDKILWRNSWFDQPGYWCHNPGHCYPPENVYRGILPGEFRHIQGKLNYRKFYVDLHQIQTCGMPA